MLNRHSLFFKLSCTAGILSALTACGASPTAMAPEATTRTLAPTQPKADAVPGKILVKVKNGMAIQSVQDMRKVQAITGLANTSVYTVPEGATIEETLTKLRRDPNVVYAEPNYRYHALEVNAKSTVNDPMYGKLWGFEKIQAPAAWDVTTGDSNVIVAVIDTGVDYNHPDLQGQVIKGPDLGNNDSDPMDDQGHGSHVAGTIAALGNNGTGVVGLAYKTKILAVKVLGSDGSGDTAAIAKGILKAAELGAKVINLSLGGPQQSQTLKDAVDQVTAKGVLCVVAAGNDGNSTANYPAAYPNAFSVGATDQSDKRTSFSQYGSTLDIAAPGLNILSTTEKSYKEHSGTSMASPHVAAAAALLLAKNPNLTPAQLREALVNSAEATTGFTGATVKRINIAKALGAVTGTTPAPAPTAPPVAEPTPAPTPDDRPTPEPIAQPTPGRQPIPGPGMQPLPGRQPIPGPGMQPMPGRQPIPGPGMQPMPGRQPIPGPGMQPMPGRQPIPGPGMQPMPGRQPIPGPGMQPMPQPYPTR